MSEFMKCHVKPGLMPYETPTKRDQVYILACMYGTWYGYIYGTSICVL